MVSKKASYMSQPTNDVTYASTSKLKSPVPTKNIDLAAEIGRHQEREDKKKLALQEPEYAKLSIIGTMSGDPFKQLHEQKTKRMQQRVSEAHRKAMT